MAQADSVFTPPTNTSQLENLFAQEAERQASLQRLSKLRRQAAAEIDRLIAFLDQSDPYVQTEREENGDEADASYPTSGAHCANPMEDDEDSDPAEDDDPAEDTHDREDDRADDEPSLGWPDGHAAHGQGMLGGFDDLELGA